MSVDTISSQIGLSKSRIYHLLTESQFVNDEIAKVPRDLVESQKFFLVCLYRKGLEKLEEDLESGERERELRGIDRVFQLWTLVNSDGGFRRLFGID
jgi:hypothetical protein